MKKIYILLLLIFIVGKSLIAQTSYNPFTQNIHFAPEPSPFGFECGTVQNVVFTQGFTTADDATQWQTDPLKVTICLSGFTFNGTATSVVSGTYASNFDWAYDPTSPNCIIGTQNQTLAGTGTNPIFPNPNSSGTIQLSLLVPQNSPVSTVLSVNVSLQVPPYMATFNSTPDDNESTQTQTFCNCYFLSDPGMISGSQSFCVSGDPVAFTSNSVGNGGSGGTILYQWQELIAGVWTNISGATNTTYDAPTTSTDKSYRRNAKRSLCGDWINSDTVSITINSLPTVNAGSDQTLTCSTTSTTIGTTEIVGNTYSWSPSTGLNAANIAQPTASPTSTTTYTLTVTGSNGCSASDTVMVNVNTVPPVAFGGPDKNLTCTITSTLIGTTNTAGYTYSWSPATGLNFTNISSPTANPTTSTNYTVTVTGLNGCTAQDTVTVNVNTNLPTASAGNDKDLNCTTTSSSIGDVTVSGNIYSWLPATGLSATNIAAPIANPTTNTTYTLTVTGSNGCVAHDTVNINVNIVPPTSDAGPNKEITCLVTSVQIGTPAVIGYSYSWSPGNGLDATNIAQPTSTPTSTTTYTVTVTGSNGCSSSSTVIVTLNNLLPNADAGLPKTICSLQDSTIIGTPSILGYSYSWSPADGLSSTTIAQPTAKPSATITYTLTVSTSNGCTSVDSVTVTVNPCYINLSGHVYNDTNALLNSKVDGILISAPDQTQLYVSLVDSNGNVIRSIAVQSDGTYEFLDVDMYQKYSLVLSSVLGIAGQPAPATDLPGLWVNTGEDCCDQTGSDLNIDGVNDINVTNFSMINIDFGIKKPGGTGLPLTLKDYVVIDYNCMGLISWTTSQEENTSHTDIYRRDANHGDFKFVTTIQNAGNSNTERMYSYEDKNVNSNTTYEYQLKFVDIDGQYTKSDIKSITLNCETESNTIQIFPNPASSVLNIVCVSEESDVEFQFDVLDITGKKILSSNKMMNNGGNLIILDIQSIARGTYLLHYQNIDGTINGSVKFIKE